MLDFLSHNVFCPLSIPSSAGTGIHFCGFFVGDLHVTPILQCQVVNIRIFVVNGSRKRAGRLITFTLTGVENVPVVPAVLDKGHQRDRLRYTGIARRAATSKRDTRSCSRPSPSSWARVRQKMAETWCSSWRCDQRCPACQPDQFCGCRVLTDELAGGSKYSR